MILAIYLEQMIKEQELAKIKNIIENDGVIAFVTDTVWGIGCLPESEVAVNKIYKIKQRDTKKPLILMSYDIYPLIKYVENIPKKAQMIVKEYFPGALTLVLEKSKNTPDYITSGLSTVGIRVPDNEVFSDICKYIEGHVLATTSANISTFPPALSYEQAREYIGADVDYVVSDCGLSPNGKASTVVGIKEDNICVYRQGDIFISA